MTPQNTVPCYCDVCHRRQNCKVVDAHTLYEHPHYEKAVVCPVCANYVFCHDGTDIPLGDITSSDIRRKRYQLHCAINELAPFVSRKQIYKYLTDEIGATFHASTCNSLEDIARAHMALSRLKKRYSTEAQVVVNC